jgi:basic amino acid/polyamine antiporter, APA family
VLGPGGLAAATAPLPDAVRAAGTDWLVPAVRVGGAVVALLAATTDVRGAIGFSSFGVLAYYAIANASAFTLTPQEGQPNRLVSVIGLAGCAALAIALPLSTVISGTAVLILGAALYGLRKARATSSRQ